MLCKGIISLLLIKVVDSCISLLHIPIGTVNPVYNDHPREEPKFVAVVDRWLLFRCSLILLELEIGTQNVGRCRQVVAFRTWLLTKI